MPVEAACPSCEGKFRLPDAAAGKKIRCPKCKGPLDVPPLTAEPPAAAAAPQAPVVETAPKPATPAEGLKSTWRTASQEPAPAETAKKESPRVEPARAESPKPQAPVIAPQPAKPTVTKTAAPATPVETPKKQAAPAQVFTPPAPAPAPTPAPAAKPKSPEPAAKPATAPAKPSVALPAPAPDLWFMKGEDGETFGPVDRPTLDQWHKEGRMTADSQLLKQGTEQWQWASDLYPDLEEPEPEPQPETKPEPVVQKAAAESSIHPAQLSDISSTKSSDSRHSQAKQAAVDEDDEEEERLSPHSKPVAFLLALTLGMFGIHRFYLGYVGLGLAMFFTFGGLLMWSITDALRILFGHVPDSEGLKLRD